MSNEDGTGQSGPAQYWNGNDRIEESAAEMLLTELGSVPEWMTEGECQNVGTDFFSRADAEEAKMICLGCPVLDQCRDYQDNQRPGTLAVIFNIIGGDVATTKK